MNKKTYKIQPGLAIVRKASLDRILKTIALTKLNYDTRAELALIRREQNRKRLGWK